MGDDLALSGVLSAVTGVEQPALARTYADEGIIEIGFECAEAVGVDRLQRSWIRDRNVIRRDAHDSTWGLHKE